MWKRRVDKKHTRHQIALHDVTWEFVRSRNGMLKEAAVFVNRTTQKKNSCLAYARETFEKL